MELIPEEAKNRAVNRLEDKVWEWADIYLSVLDDIIGRRLQVEKKIKVLDDELEEMTDRLKRQVKPKGASTKAPIVAPLAAPDNDILGVLGTYQNAILGQATASELKTPLDAPISWSAGSKSWRMNEERSLRKSEACVCGRRVVLRSARRS